MAMDDRGCCSRADVSRRYRITVSAEASTMQLEATLSMDGSMANCSGTASTAIAIKQLKMACLTVMALRTRYGSMPAKARPMMAFMAFSLWFPLAMLRA